MKKIGLVFSLVLFFSVSFQINAQWFWQNPIPGNNFSTNKIKFFDENNGIVIGTEGLIFMTTNGGLTWGPIYTGENEKLIDISFINQNFGIIISEQSILKTTDGGLTWNKILEAGPNTEYRYCSIADSINFFIGLFEWVGNHSYILSTNDGGITWNQSSVFNGSPLDLYFINQNVGFYFVGNKIYRTIDGGINWASTQFPTIYEAYISFCDSLNGILMGTYTYVTNDGGVTWNQANSPAESVKDVLEYAPDLIIAAGSNKSIYKSTDQGNTWTQLLRLGGGTMIRFTSISVVNNFYYVAGQGAMYKSSDSGENWFSIKQGTTEYLYSIDMVNRDFGITVGGNGVIVTTHNGGAIWEIQNSGTDEYLYSVVCIDTLNAIAAGFHGTIIKTTDGGESWIPKNSGVSISIYHLEMLNQNIGIAVGWGGTLLRTTDGGDTWQSQIISPMNFWVSEYMDSSNIFIGGSIANGYGYILRSQNAGVSWDTVYQVLYKYPQSMCRLGEQSLIVTASDGLIIKSTDLGDSWTTVNTPRQYHCRLSFIDSLNGLLSFDDGHIYRTTNGGNSWNSEWPFYAELRDIQMLNIEDAVAVGFYGTIISTITDHIMPVELTSFSGYCENQGVYLSWSTSTELNNNGFEIQRCTDKNNWYTVGFVKGVGTTSEPQHYKFVNDVSHISSPNLYYRLKQMDFNGTFEYSNTLEVEINVPIKFSLEQNYPNPFNPSTKISWQSPVGSWQTLKVYDILGNEVATLVNEYRNPGNYEVDFQSSVGSRRLANGVYFYRLQVGDFIETKKMILLK